MRSSVRSAKAASPLSWRAVKLSDSRLDPGHRSSRHYVRRACRARSSRTERRSALEPAAADSADLGAGAVELLVGHHRRALEGQVAVDLDPGAAAVVLVADPDRDRPRDAVDPQQQDVQRVAPLPVEALLGVVGGPDVEGREGVDGARVGDRDVVGDFGPGAQADAVRLGDAAVLDQRPRRRLLVGPDTLLERAAAARGGGTRGPGCSAGGRRWGRGRSARARARSACSPRGCRPCAGSAAARPRRAHEPLRPIP